ncbi:S-adenosyl-L-methionine-dependent methyltransferase, putative [Plasmodium ovale wallikeri]|uniref:S-adenosyl-L-methionine-dependent methyltransferase n=2 Tax=Plasmodium ovale TaxID=36330 RepID=A0A1C3KN45_PLAOA|nr:S-adenosyl-L-methionine-dependent methyltransferase, putative [Plasmodium ovale wallikeri]SBT75465.1 conserved Plasmodium protein, unknown function [Plasmodium ovale]
MEVLPAGYSDFRSREYWNNFFRSFDKKNFEWYGNYGDIKKIVYECIRRRFNYCDSSLECSSLKREILNKNCLLINTGCGNSNVSYEFFEDGFEYIINIDYSEVVIEKMKKKYGKIMEFINIDVSNTDKFDTLLQNLEKERLKRKKEYKLFFDKAFLDAYISCEKNEEDICKENAKNYFSIIFKHLNEGDIFLIITLAQYYITKEIVRNIYDKNVMLEVIPFLLKNNTCEFKYHPFLFAFYKNKKNIKDYTVKFTHLGDKTTNDISLWKLPQEINNTRECVNLHTFRKGKRFTLDIFNKNVNECHYNVIVYDSSNDVIKYNTVVIVVPFGYEFHWIYSTPEGNEQLATQAGAKRLLLVMRSNFWGKSGIVDVRIPVVHNDKRENPASLCPENDLNNGLNGIGAKQIGRHGVNEHFDEREGGKEKRNNKKKKEEEEEEAILTSNPPLGNSLYSEFNEGKNSVYILLDTIKNELRNILNEISLPNSKNFPIMVLNEEVRNCKIISHEKSNFCVSIIIRDVLITQEFIEENFGIRNGEEIQKGKNLQRKTRKKRNKLKKRNSAKSSSGDMQTEKEFTQTNLEKKKEERENYFRSRAIYKRQMIFSCDPLTVQSELIYTRENEETEVSEEKVTTTGSAPAFETDRINFEYIESASQYHVNFCCSVFFVINENIEREDKFVNICILGGGTNVLSNVMKTVFPNLYLHFDVVEIDETVKKFYSLFCNEEMLTSEKQVTNYVIMDSYDYIKDSQKNEFYDIIFLDINNSQNSYIKINDQKLYLTCPHIKFLKEEIINNMKHILKKSGILVINLLTRDTNARKYVHHFFKSLFRSVVSILSTNKEINEVLICSLEEVTAEKVTSLESCLIERMNKSDKWFLNFDVENFLSNVKVL